jgi:hypothetical protein
MPYKSGWYVSPDEIVFQHYHNGWYCSFDEVSILNTLDSVLKRNEGWTVSYKDLVNTNFHLPVHFMLGDNDEHLLL